MAHLFRQVMKVKINELTQLDRDILFALIDHFKYSVKDIDSYSELTDEEKYIISEDTWNKMLPKQRESELNCLS